MNEKHWCISKRRQRFVLLFGATRTNHCSYVGCQHACHSQNTISPMFSGKHGKNSVIALPAAARSAQDDRDKTTAVG